jgi:hypothetical protein
MKSTWRTIVVAFIAAVSIQAQEPPVVVPPATPEQERWLATQPPEVQAYSRYRHWVSFQPTTPRLVNPELLERYRGYLTARGMSAADAQEQIRLIRSLTPIPMLSW